MPRTGKKNRGGGPNDSKTRVMHVRLMLDVAHLLRRNFEQKGDLSKALDSILDKTDLGCVPLLDISFADGLQTTVWTISESNFNKLHRAAAYRECSVNGLVNSMIHNAVQ